MIRVGGATEVEVKEKKDRVDDALNATRAAVEEGIVPGGGVALLRAKAAVGKLKSDNADVQAGINIVLKALESPIRQIVENAGVEGSIVVGKIIDNKSQTYGFDAQTEEYVDMIEAGIVDPAKVVRTALQDAASVAGLLITTEAMVAEMPKEKPAMPMGGGAAAAWAAWTSEPGGGHAEELNRGGFGRPFFVGSQGSRRRRCAQGAPRSSAKLSLLRNSGAAKSAPREIFAAPVGEFDYERRRPSTNGARGLFEAESRRGGADEENSACHPLCVPQFPLVRLHARSVAPYGPAPALSAL